MTHMAHIVFLLDISALDHYWLNEPVDLEWTIFEWKKVAKVV